MSPLRQVLRQNLCTLPHRLVGYEQGIVRQQAPPERALSAGCCTKVEHAARRRGIVGSNRLPRLFDEHGRGFLHIVSSGMQARIKGEGGAFGEIPPLGTPCHGLQPFRLCRQGGGEFQGIEAYADGGRSLRQHMAECLSLLGAETLCHLCDKCWMEHTE